MRYLLDTVTLIRHFSAKGKIGKTAQQILDKAGINDADFFISTITLMEIMYLAEKKRISIDLDETLNRIQENSLYTIIDLSADILQVAQTVTFYELHDRLILATAKWLEIPVLSSDEKFKELDGIQVIWD